MDHVEIRTVDIAGSPAPKAPKKRGVWWVVKWGMIWVSLLVIVLVLVSFRIPPGQGRPFVRISPQTTWATSPLKPNGDVDYVAFLNQQHAVPPENNAYVEILKIKGPMALRQMPPPRFFELLGIQPPPEAGDYFRDFPWIKKSTGTSTVLADGTELDSKQVNFLTSSVPFAKGDFPVVDAWVEQNRHHFQAFHVAVRKPGFYVPYVGESVVGVVQSYMEEMRNIARGLLRSSMAHLGRGDVAEAIDDQIAMLRLARHVGHQGVLVELLLGHAIEGMGHGSLAQTIFSGKCTAADLERLADELKSLPALPTLNARHLQAERAMGLDLAIQIGRYGPIPWNGVPDLLEVESSHPKPGLGDKLGRASIDWEVVCIKLNEFYDDLEQTVIPEGMMERADAMRNFEGEMKALETKTWTPAAMLGSIVGGRTRRGETAGNILAELILPAVHSIFDASRRVTAHEAVTLAAIAVERFRLAHGKLPKSLDQLVPEFLEAVPMDPFTGKSLVYNPVQGDPYLLYSLGPNKVDDGGIGMDEGQYPKIDLTAAPKIRTVQEWIAEEMKKE